MYVHVPVNSENTSYANMSNFYICKICITNFCSCFYHNLWNCVSMDDTCIYVMLTPSPAYRVLAYGAVQMLLLLLLDRCYSHDGRARNIYRLFSQVLLYK